MEWSSKVGQRIYGPATSHNLTYWLTEGLGAPRRRLDAWVDDLRDEVTDAQIDGTRGYVLNTDLEALNASAPSDALQLLPGFDPWIMGPGTADSRVISPKRRGLATKGSNIVIRDGVVCGTWRVQRTEAAVSWFNEAGPAPAAELSDAVDACPASSTAILPPPSLEGMADDPIAQTVAALLRYAMPKRPTHPSDSRNNHR